MKRKRYIVAMIFAVSMFLGCSAAAPFVQVGAGLAGKGIGDNISNQQTAYVKANEAPISQGKIERVMEVSVGSNVVKVDKDITPGRFSLVYSAYKGGALIEKIVRVMSPDDYLAETRRIRMMTEKDKKDYVCKIFLAKNIDLAAEERPQPNELTETRPLKTSPGPSLTVPGFAPTPSKPR